jgi:CRISPR-associated protein Cmr3
MNATAVFLEPLDLLILRGNKLFGDAGSYSEALMPPWPSVAAGALRSRMLVDAGIDLVAFAVGGVSHPTLGTPKQPGPFRLTTFHLARRTASGGVQALLTPPADLVICERPTASPGEPDGIEVRHIKPRKLAQGIEGSHPLPLAPVLAEPTRAKAKAGYWLTDAGWAAWLAGNTPDAMEFVPAKKLWQTDPRVGVGLDADRRAVSEGKLFTVDGVAPCTDVGFVVTIEAAEMPTDGMVRFGGDGRAAALHPVNWVLPQPDFVALAASRRVRMVLTSPAIFAQGWLPTGAEPQTRRDDGAVRFALRNVKGWIVSACVPRAEVASGWDLARWEPKPAQRFVPAGSLWWLELDVDVTADDLRKLAIHGLWEERCHDAQRRAEGFNQVALAAWSN